jgi:hypothetical protein
VAQKLFSEETDPLFHPLAISVGVCLQIMHATFLESKGKGVSRVSVRPCPPVPQTAGPRTGDCFFTSAALQRVTR